MFGQMTDKDLLQDLLVTEKYITSAYDNFANESANPSLRQSVLNILNDEHNIQSDLWNTMNQRGWYQVQPAQPQQIQSAISQVMGGGVTISRIGQQFGQQPMGQQQMGQFGQQAIGQQQFGQQQMGGFSGGVTLTPSLAQAQNVLQSNLSNMRQQVMNDWTQTNPDYQMQAGGYGQQQFGRY